MRAGGLFFPQKQPLDGQWPKHVFVLSKASKAKAFGCHDEHENSVKIGQWQLKQNPRFVQRRLSQLPKSSPVEGA